MSSFVILLVCLFCSFNIYAFPKKGPKDIWVLQIDTGVSRHPKLEGFVQYDNSSNYKDDEDHGTPVAGVIIYGNQVYNYLTPKIPPNWSDKVCSNVKIFSCKFTINTLGLKAKEINKIVNKNLINCINLATEMKVDYISISAGGKYVPDSTYFALKKFSNQGGITIAAMGNNSQDLRIFTNSFFPASWAFWDGFSMVQRLAKDFTGKPMFYPLNIIPVANSLSQDNLYILSRTSNYHPEGLTMVGTNVYSVSRNGGYGYYSGTSLSAPAVTHLILKRRCEKINSK